ncbi:hypothetical protein CLOM_g2839 [Closterium sp. NIES-68]|nr:hypothetical protein CLOM_g2839 [Closterium sp. NIES-68]GJP74785.1 hypothetical protein CLOP_g5323 [Closterium sp. NIES-67]GJP80883.1 hypothetical protein CLOP_g11082 [Closterium sp. NIES-67]
MSATWGLSRLVPLLLVVLAVLPTSPVSAAPRHNEVLQCPANANGTGNLFLPTLEAGAVAAGTVAWRTTREKFLLLHCVRGQISNRVLCIKNHLLLAGLLSRTLIVPFHHSEVVRNYNMHVALDVEHLRRCFGKVVFTTAEYRRKFVKPINVTEVVCWHGPKGACREEDKELLLNCPAPETMSTPASVLVGGDGEALLKIGKPGFVFNTRVRITRTLFRGQLTQISGNHTALAACLPMAATKTQVLEAYGSNPSRVLVVGDLVNVQFAEWPEAEAALDLPFKRSDKCPTALLIKPAGAMFLAAELFVREAFQGEPFIGMHWRRGDFKAYCFWHGPKNACYFPVQQVAYWVYRKTRELAINNLFLATNAKHAELEELTVLLNQMSDYKLNIVRLPSVREKSKEKWMRPIQHLTLGRTELIPVALEKLICAQSHVFWGSVASTFSMDIQRLRHGLRVASCNDTTICYGEKEWIRNRG